MDICKYDKAIREKTIGKTWQYLHDNFHKFSDATKLKVALALCTKSIPQEIEGNITFNKTPEVYIGDRKMEYNIGSRIAEHTEEIRTSPN